MPTSARPRDANFTGSREVEFCVVCHIPLLEGVDTTSEGDLAARADIQARVTPRLYCLFCIGSHIDILLADTDGWHRHEAVEQRQGLWCHLCAIDCTGSTQLVEVGIVEGCTLTHEERITHHLARGIAKETSLPMLTSAPSPNQGPLLLRLAATSPLITLTFSRRMTPSLPKTTKLPRSTPD
jgi:hypothetical protein